MPRLAPLGATAALLCAACTSSHAGPSDDAGPMSSDAHRERDAGGAAEDAAPPLDRDGGPPIARDGGVGPVECHVGAPGSGNPGQIACGPAGLCDIGQLCCTDLDAPRCIDRMMDDRAFAPCAGCDDDGDCDALGRPDEICCGGPYAAGGGYRQECMPAADCTGGGEPICPDVGCRPLPGLPCVDDAPGEVLCRHGAYACAPGEICCPWEEEGSGCRPPGDDCPLYAACDDDEDCAVRGPAGSLCCFELGLGAHAVHRCVLRDECRMPVCDSTGSCTPHPY